MIKISIIIPVYNAEQYLEQCLESVINQSLKEIEIICVNDGSIDNSLRILEEYSRKDNRIIIINQENGGASKARNSALQIAKGEYCLNIDSDDWINEEYFKSLYDKAKSKNLDILISDINFIELNNKSIYQKDLKILDTDLISGKKYIQIFLRENFYGYTWNKLIKRELYTKNNIKYNEKIFMFEDVELILKVAYFSERVGKINLAFYNYRQGENNNTRKIKNKNFYDMLECYKNLEVFFEKRNEDKLKKIVARKKILSLLRQLLINGYGENDENKKVYFEYLEELRKEKMIFFPKKKENIKLIFIYDLLKIFPKSYLLENIRRLIQKWIK